MIGTKLFQFVFSNLGEECRRKILRNIFEIQDVSIADISFREDKVIFRFFSDDVFYQFIFIFGNSNNKFISVSSSNRLFNCLVFVNMYSSFYYNDYFEILVKVFQCQEEYQVYQLMSLLL